MTPGTIVTWWSISGEGVGPRCGIVKRLGPAYTVVDNFGTEIHVHLDTMPPEHRPRRVGVVDEEGRPQWDV